MIENLSRRGTADAYPSPLRNAPNAALLIDFDNVTMGIRSDLQVQLKRMLNSEVFKGKISVQRAYADWRRYPQYIVPLSEASIDLIFAPAFGSNKKNATDIRLAIDALELVFTRPEIGTYILLSGDSDFSSLVLKLKEFGKYVIGVGIRESSSDLLIQNCDEYYSYNELTGLLKEGEVEHRRRDPWELVVDAVSRMRQSDDVMRSDRLKQVMQEIDPDFSEKDAGFSKYSKFLQEAGRRGLLKLVKLDNGQYEIALGANANVPIEVEQAMAQAPSPEPRKSERESGGSRRRGRNRSGGDTPDHGEGLSLSAAFDLLRRALTDIGAVGEESTDVDQARERMADLGDGDDPLYETRRFQRFLRQAHDADLIDLAKTDDGAYLLRLRPGDDNGKDDKDKDKDDDEGGERRGRRRRGERGGRTRRGRRSKDDDKADADDERAKPKASSGKAASRGAEDTAPAGARADGGDAREKSASGRSGESAGRRNPRYRRGSRGGSSAAAAPPEPEPTAADEKPAVSGPVAHNRSLRGRRGRRGAEPAPERQAAEPQARREEPAAEPTRRAPAPAPDAAPRTPAPEVPTAPATTAGAGPEREEGGGLFKRMSAALQRAMLGDAKDGEQSGS